MSEHDEPDPFPEASVPETPEGEVSPDALSASRSGAPAVPPSEAPTLPLIPVDQLRFQTGGAASDAAVPVASSDSDARPVTSTPMPPPPAGIPAAPTVSAAPPEGATPVEREDAGPVEREAVPQVEGEAARDVERDSAPRAVAMSPAAESPPPNSPAAASVRAVPRDLVDRREPLYRDCQGYRLRLDPADLARLRELAGSRGRSDDEIGEAFFDGQADRFAESLVGDVPIPSEIRVIVDPYSRQAFLALENRIRGILSF